MTTTTLPADLAGHYKLSDEAIRHFREKGFVKLKNVLSPETLKQYGEEITRMVKVLNKQTKPMHERNTYEKAFLQVSNIWEKDETVREFAFAPKLARIAAELMGVKGVRMYHDQALYKEPSGGFTPWHADQYYWPLSNHNSVTVWIPLQDTPLNLGPLAFSVGSHKFEKGRDMPISDESEAQIQKALADQNFPLDEGPFDLGEVSYHYGWTFHRAGPNTSDRSRSVMTMIYIEDGIRITEPVNKHQHADLARWMPGQKPGDVVDSPLNPVLYRAK